MISQFWSEAMEAPKASSGPGESPEMMVVGASRVCAAAIEHGANVIMAPIKAAGTSSFLRDRVDRKGRPVAAHRAARVHVDQLGAHHGIELSRRGNVCLAGIALRSDAESAQAEAGSAFARENSGMRVADIEFAPGWAKSAYRQSQQTPFPVAPTWDEPDPAPIFCR
jgi:hypothetical protein